MNASIESLETRPLPPAESLEEVSPTKKGLNQVIQSLVRRFNSDFTSSGDLAELRRLDPRLETFTIGGAFWRVAIRDLEPNGLLKVDDDESRKRWMAILQGLAMVYDLNGEPLRLGQAIAQAEISEARLIRLLRASGDSLLAQVRPIAHQLRSKAQPVDWLDMARLLLSDGRSHADEVRRHIASDFYRQDYKQSKKDSAQSA